MEQSIKKITKIFIYVMFGLFICTSIFKFLPSNKVIDFINGFFNILKIDLNMAFVIYVSFVLNKKSKIVNTIIVVSNFIADLLLIDQSQTSILISMIFFCIVSFGYQYILIVNNDNKKQVVVENIIRTIFQVTVQIIILLLLKENWSFLLCFVGIYGVNLICNMIFAFVGYKQNKYLAFGLLFFFLCDIFVGLQSGVAIDVIPCTEGSFLDGLISFPICDCWLYYSISQPLLGLSFIKSK